MRYPENDFVDGFISTLASEFLQYEGKTGMPLNSALFHFCLAEDGRWVDCSHLARSNGGAEMKTELWDYIFRCFLVIINLNSVLRASPELDVTQSVSHSLQTNAHSPFLTRNYSKRPRNTLHCSCFLNCVLHKRKARDH